MNKNREKRKEIEEFGLNVTNAELFIVNKEIYNMFKLTLLSKKAAMRVIVEARETFSCKLIVDNGRSDNLDNSNNRLDQS